MARPHSRILDSNDRRAVSTDSFAFSDFFFRIAGTFSKVSKVVRVLDFGYRYRVVGITVSRVVRSFVLRFGFVFEFRTIGAFSPVTRSSCRIGRLARSSVFVNDDELACLGLVRLLFLLL